MRMMRFISSPLDGLPDVVHDFLARRALEAVGATLIAASGATALALASWSVSDPSINHAVNGTVRNLAGYPGAVVSDIMMQMVGLASSAALMPPLLWGLRLVWRRKLTPLWPRLAMWIIGTLAAAGFASACPTSARWPLPTGLGGVAGDAILGLFATFSMAHGVGRLVIAAGLAIVAILALTASISSGGDPSRRMTSEDDEPVSMPLRGPAGSRLDDFEDADAEPGLALLSAGALAHAFLSAKSALARRLQARALNASERGSGLVQREPRLRWRRRPTGSGSCRADGTAPRASRSTIFSRSCRGNLPLWAVTL